MQALLVGRAGLTADGMLPRFWGCRWWRRWRGRRRRPRSFPEELPRPAASMAGLCRGACGPPGQRSNRRSWPMRTSSPPRGWGGLDGRTGIPRQRRPGRPAFFAPVPSSRPGRVRSTFSMRLDPAATTRDDVQPSARAAGRLAGQNPPPGGISRPGRTPRQDQGGRGWSLVARLRTQASERLSARWAMGRALDREAQQEIGRSIIVDLLQARRRSACPPASEHGRCWSRTVSRRRSSMPCSGWVGCNRWWMTTGSRTSSSPATTPSG